MIKRAIFLGLAVALLVVVPAAAGMTVGDRIGVLDHTPAEFGAGDPFHVKHGFALLTPQDDGPISGWLFELEVDGAYVRHSFIDVDVTKDEDGNVTQTRWWVFNFPDGLPAGPHEFIGHWSKPCRQTEEACDRPNEPIEFFTTSHTVDFIFICRDSLGCVTYAEGDPVNLGTSLSLTGLEFFGVDELRGVEIALDDHGDLFGHEVALINADSMCNADGGETAANAIVADPGNAAVQVIRTVIVLSPIQATEKLIDEIEQLVEGGILNTGQGNSLTSKLDNAIKLINRDRINAACNIIEAFVNQTNAFINGGTLSGEQGQSLIDFVQRIQTSLGCD